MNSREATIALNMLPRIGPVRVKKMVEKFGSAEAIFQANRSDLLEVKGLGEKTVDIIVDWESYIDLVAEMEMASQRGINIITQEDESYPSKLLGNYDPPLVLYVWGELDSRDNHGIAMVGSRRHSHYGQQSARKLSFQLANSGFTIISGLARGIDTFSHEGAIAAKGRTIAVIGSGLNQLYPPENMELAEKIANGFGAVVSEFPLNAKPDKKTFPMRNRIVAGWGEGVLVIECPKWSGSLITANLANEMGKPVYAVPGQIDSPTSAGCNELIRNGASLVSCAEDILRDREELPLFEMEKKDFSVNPALLNLSEREQQVVDVLNSQPQLLDQLLSLTEMPLPELNVILLQLEIKKVVQQLAGQRYVLKSGQI